MLNFAYCTARHYEFFNAVTTFVLITFPLCKQKPNAVKCIALNVAESSAREPIEASENIALQNLISAMF